jgi:hypothetical protein
MYDGNMIHKSTSTGVCHTKPQRRLTHPYCLASPTVALSIGISWEAPSKAGSNTGRPRACSTLQRTLLLGTVAFELSELGNHYWNLSDSTSSLNKHTNMNRMWWALSVWIVCKSLLACWVFREMVGTLEVDKAKSLYWARQEAIGTSDLKSNGVDALRLITFFLNYKDFVCHWTS